MRLLHYLEVRNFKRFGDAQRIELDHPAVQRIKLSLFAEDFFRRLAERFGHAMLLRKGDLHRLVDHLRAREVADEVSVKLDLLEDLFANAQPHEES